MSTTPQNENTITLLPLAKKTRGPKPRMSDEWEEPEPEPQPQETRELEELHELCAWDVPEAEESDESDETAHEELTAWGVFLRDVRKANDPILTAIFRAAWAAVKIANREQRQHDFKNVVLAAVSEAVVDIKEARIRKTKLTPKLAATVARTAAARLARRETRLPHQALPTTEKSVRVRSRSNGGSYTFTAYRTEPESVRKVDVAGHGGEGKVEGWVPPAHADWLLIHAEEDARIAAIDQITRRRLVSIIGEVELDWLLDYELAGGDRPKNRRDRVRSMRLKRKIAASELAGDYPTPAATKKPVASVTQRLDEETRLARLRGVVAAYSVTKRA